MPQLLGGWGGSWAVRGMGRCGRRVRRGLLQVEGLWYRMTHFYVYAIVFDQDCFGIFGTREEAEASLAKQTAEGGPAWEDCEVERWQVEGRPETDDDSAKETA